MLSAISSISTIDQYSEAICRQVDALLGMPEPFLCRSFEKSDVRGSCQTFYSVGWDAENLRTCDDVGTVTDLDTGMTFCASCWRVNFLRS